MSEIQTSPPVGEVDAVAARKALQSEKMKAAWAARKAKAAAGAAEASPAVEAPPPHPVVAEAARSPGILLDPVQFLMVFFSTNPGLIQVLEAYPNKTAAAEGLYLNAYKAYLEIADPSRNKALWAQYEAAKSRISVE